MKLRKRQPERQPAMELRQALEARGATIRQAVRALLRDFGYGTVTPKAAEEVQRALTEAGVAYEPELVGAKPSHMVTLSVAKPVEAAAPVAETVVEEQPEVVAEAGTAEPIEVEEEAVEPEVVEAASNGAQVSKLQALIDQRQKVWEKERAEAEARTAEACGALAEAHEQNEREREHRAKLEQRLEAAMQTEHELRAELSNEHARRAKEAADAERRVATLPNELEHERET